MNLILILFKQIQYFQFNIKTLFGVVLKSAEINSFKNNSSYVYKTYT